MYTYLLTETILTPVKRVVIFAVFTQIYFFYRPIRSLRQGNIFTGVCDSVHRGGAPDLCSNFLGG